MTVMGCLTCVRFDRMRLESTMIYWTLIGIARERHRKNPIESWEEMKHKLKEKYLPEFYRNRLLDKLHNLRQGSMSV